MTVRQDGLSLLDTPHISADLIAHQYTYVSPTDYISIMLGAHLSVPDASVSASSANIPEEYGPVSAVAARIPAEGAPAPADATSTPKSYCHVCQACYTGSPSEHLHDPAHLEAERNMSMVQGRCILLGSYTNIETHCRICRTSYTGRLLDHLASAAHKKAERILCRPAKHTRRCCRCLNDIPIGRFARHRSIAKSKKSKHRCKALNTQVECSTCMNSFLASRVEDHLSGVKHCRNAFASPHSIVCDADQCTEVLTFDKWVKHVEGNPDHKTCMITCNLCLLLFEHPDFWVRHLSDYNHRVNLSALSTKKLLGESLGDKLWKCWCGEQFIPGDANAHLKIYHLKLQSRPMLQTTRAARR